ncbi:MAG: cytochrome c3 family protein [Desulfosarcina sp.]|nr:cytochrome c3 family protein [Desulfosarcina sp.]MBC2742513.1 cytochrome c3 family protein [Desulfosarcina sp.]MBC2765423.1 cytochrome c3 family protein [Desulfosarcina sp.]
MGKRNFIVLAAVCVALMFAAGSIYAGTAVQDVIKMENKAYSEHKKSIMTFTHKKHNEEYKIGCGECHHDDKGKPLNDLKIGDDVQNCIECHKIPGEVPKEIKKEWKAKKTPRAEKKKVEKEYHAEMIHDNCIGCHKAYNKKNKTKAAPQTCTKCHPKKKE